MSIVPFLWLGDLLMAVTSVFAALYTWRQYNLFVLVARLCRAGVFPGQGKRLAVLSNTIEVRLWFYLLPIVWMLLARGVIRTPCRQQWKKNNAWDCHCRIYWTRCVFPCVYHPARTRILPRIGVGAFLLFASILTLSWRMVFIRIYKRQVNAGVFC